MSIPKHGGGGKLPPPPWFPPYQYYNTGWTLAPAGNGEMLIGFIDGHIYSYNPTTGGASLLENLAVSGEAAGGASSALWQVGGFQQYRWAVYDGSSETQLSFWESDTAPSTGTAQVESSIWDFDLPEQRMILDGFSIVCDKPEDLDTVEVAYQIDQDGVWHNLSVIDSSVTRLRSWRAASNTTSTVEFSQLQFRTTISGAPKVYSVTAQARVADFSETWDVLVRLADEKPNQRVRGRQASGGTLRQYLWQLKRSKQVVAFEDAYVSHRPGEFLTYAVTVEEVQDFIDVAGEGKAKVSLRRVFATDDEDQVSTQPPLSSGILGSPSSDSGG